MAKKQMKRASTSLNGKRNANQNHKKISLYTYRDSHQKITSIAEDVHPVDGTIK
jgi:hypothetical protein